MNGHLRAVPDNIARAIGAVEQRADMGVEVTIKLPSGRDAMLRFPVPLTPQDLVQLMVTLGDIATGRLNQVAQDIEGDAPDAVRSRLAARGIVTP